MPENATPPPTGEGTPRVGRPPKLTRDVLERIVALIRAGNYVDTAAEACDVGPSTMRRWLQEGGADGAPELKRELRERVDSAKSECEARNVAIVAAAARKSWQAAAWLLERQYPDRWAKQSQRDRTAREPRTGQSNDPFAEVDELARRRRPA